VTTVGRLCIAPDGGGIGKYGADQSFVEGEFVVRGLRKTPVALCLTECK
jgi:hypothetical protein